MGGDPNKLYKDYLDSKNPDGSDIVGPISVSAPTPTPGVTVGGYSGDAMTPASAAQTDDGNALYRTFMGIAKAPHDFYKAYEKGAKEAYKNSTANDRVFDESGGGLVQVKGPAVPDSAADAKDANGNPIAIPQRLPPGSMVGPPLPPPGAQAAPTQPTTPATQQRLNAGYGGGGGALARPHWADTAYGPAREMNEDYFKNAPERMMDQSIDQRLQFQAYRDQMDKQIAEGQAQRDAAALEQQRQQAAQEKAQSDFAAAQKVAANAAVDPSKFWENKGAGGTFMAILGSALGGMASGLMHTPNWAMDSLNKAIDTDMRAQEANLQNKNKASDTALAVLRDQTGSLESAKSAYKIAATQLAQSELAKLGVTDQENQLARALQGQLDKLQLDHAAYEQNTHQLVQPKPMGGGMGGPNMGKVFVGPDGKTMIAATDKDREEMAKQAGLLKNLEQAANEYKRVQGEKGGILTGVGHALGVGSDQHEIDQARKRYEDAVHEFKSMGGVKPMRANEEERISDQSGNGAGIITHMDDVDATLARARAEYTNHLSSGDAKEGAQGYVRDPNTGELKPASAYTGQDAPSAARPMPSSFKPIQ